MTAEEDTIAIRLQRGGTDAGRIQLLVRELPGILGPPPGDRPATALDPGDAADRAESRSVARDLLELDPLALRDATRLKAFFGGVVARGDDAVWCWDARLPRFFELAGVAPGAREVTIDLGDG